MDAIADQLGLDRAEVRARNFITPDEMPYDHQLTFQDGRPLIYDSGDFPASLEKLKDARRLGRACWPTPRRPGRTGAGSASGWPATSRAPASGPTRARTCVVESSGKVKVATGLTTQGQGHFTSFAQIAADELGVPVSRTSRWSPATPGGSATRSARSPRGRR